MVLSDVDIQRAMEERVIKIWPLADPDKQIQPASVDLRLSNWFIDPNVDSPQPFAADEILLYPGRFILGATVENVTLSSEICAQVSGKSSLGRIGITVHQTAGFIDPGFTGVITLEICNMSTNLITLTANMLICQVVFFLLLTQCKKPYGIDRGSKYISPVRPQASLLEEMTKGIKLNKGAVSEGKLAQSTIAAVEKEKGLNILNALNTRYVERGIYQDIINCALEAEKVPEYQSLPREVELLLSRLRTIASRIDQ